MRIRRAILPPVILAIGTASVLGAAPVAAATSQAMTYHAAAPQAMTYHAAAPQLMTYHG